MLLLSVFVFFFKQKTAYEMRISDWSSDLCSSDLDDPFERAETEIVRGPEGTETLRIAVLRHQFDPRLRRNDDHHPEGERDQQPRAPRLCERPRPAELRPKSRTRIARDEDTKGQSPAVVRAHTDRTRAE